MPKVVRVIEYEAKDMADIDRLLLAALLTHSKTCKPGDATHFGPFLGSKTAPQVTIRLRAEVRSIDDETFEQTFTMGDVRLIAPDTMPAPPHASAAKPTKE